MKMKLLLIATIATFATLALLPNQSMAQDKPATKLMQLRTAENLEQIEAGDTIVMSCPKCKETYSSVATKSLKGTQPDEMKTMSKHLCPTCSTVIKTEGSGKSATTKLVHTCNSCGSEEVTCCLMKKDGKPTTGMDEKK